MAKAKLALLLILLLSLLILTTVTSSAVASPDVVKWSRVNIPTEGKPGSWVLADSSDVQHLTMAIDGSLYCYANPSGTSRRLFKSTNGGYSWSETNYGGDSIADIAGSSLAANILYVTDGSHVYRSDDSGNSFNEVADASLVALNIKPITCLDVGYDANSKPYVFIGTADSNYGGGVYYIPEADSEASWTDLKVGEYDVYSIACSTEFAADHQLVAVVTDANKTWVKNNYDVEDTWTTGVELKKDDSSSFTITTASNICFPSHFDSEYELFVGVVGAGGDVYRVTATEAYDLGVDKDIISLDLAGNIQLLAGENGAGVWRSPDAGINWTRSTKQPTGEGKTYVVMASDFAASGKAYAATSGDDSAFSSTTDGGITWNQLGLIDTKLSEIVDLAPSPNYSQDNTLFMVTRGTGGKYSLWRSLNSGTNWERVYSSALPDVNIIDGVELSPQYGSGSQVVFIAGTSNSEPAIWKSTDNGQSFGAPQFTGDPTTGASFPIKTWAVVNDDTLFIGSFDGNNGLVYSTIDSGSSYSNPAVAGDQSLYSIGLSPNYEQDGTILVGNRDGWVYWSQDNGISFEPLPLDASSPPLTGKVTVAFDPQFSSNNTVYAASDTEATAEDKERIYRFIIGASTNWESIDSTLPSGGKIDQLIVSADGVLYAANSQLVDGANKQGGIERCLNPTYSLGPTFETVTRGLDDGAKLTGLWLCGNQLWSIDAINNRLMTYTDTLAVPVTLTSPSDRAQGVDTRNVSLEWEILSGATNYKWQLDYDTDFSAVPDEFEDDTKVSSTRLPTLEPATTYYWRVRVIEPVLSPWSATRLFTTSLGTSVIAPSLKSPGSGAKKVELEPVFQWGAIAGADSYELLVSRDVYFVNSIIKKTALPATAWRSDISLGYDTTYYWKVRASGSDTHSAWSAVSAFTTKSSPASEPLPPQLTAPNLYSPEAGAGGAPVKPIFQWSAIAGAGSYELLVSRDVSFVSSIIRKTALPATAWQSDISLDYDTTYYWKVRAIESNTHSAWSAIGAFTTRSSPVSEPPPSHLTAPVPNIPEAGTGGVTLKPIFQWSTVAGANSYELLVSTDVSFANPVIVKIGDYALPATAWQSDISLDYDTTYYWKVRAIGSETHSAWSAVGAFTTESSPASEPLPPPSHSIVPVVNAPGGGARGESVKPIFQWSTVAGANSYELLVSTDTSFANPVIVKIGDYALPATAWQSDISLDCDTTYYWKVRAIGSETYSAWSAVSAFTTESPPPEPTLPSAPPQPPPQSTTTPDWAIYLVGALVLTMVLQLIIILVLAIRRP